MFARPFLVKHGNYFSAYFAADFLIPIGWLPMLQMRQHDMLCIVPNANYYYMNVMSLVKTNKIAGDKNGHAHYEPEKKCSSLEWQLGDWYLRYAVGGLWREGGIDD